MKYQYFCDRETKGTFRFQPEARAERELGKATIYLSKDWLTKNKINPSDGLLIEISSCVEAAHDKV